MSNFNTLIIEGRELFDAGKYKEATKVFLRSLEQTKDVEEKAKVWAELCWSFYKAK